MNELDEFVEGPLSNKLNDLNKKNISNTGRTIRRFNKNYLSIRDKGNRFERILKKIKTKIKRIPSDDRETLSKLPKRIFGVVKPIRLTGHEKHKVSSATSNKKTLRFFYVRYADDWILLTNGNKEIAGKLKLQIDNFLQNNLYLRLSEKKTLITDITKKPATYLGFELKVSARFAKQKAIRRVPTKGRILKKYNLQKKSGLLVWTAIDRKR